ncbi:hypothetical protein [Chengkuizengella axinellae]|uniref:Uncharacterized protein n=1 Tax=Chengkuizengella axinellae TaxID=3064388 RepID=A0ABT9IUA3_9BACL|nr:hypothetical protein [Chengkuizengella sp. 2205SS18-9]MDP5272915.1 hypothetical protein [Chengkuizengella sp. 2205SS18-9]
MRTIFNVKSYGFKEVDIGNKSIIKKSKDIDQLCLGEEIEIIKTQYIVDFDSMNHNENFEVIINSADYGLTPVILPLSCKNLVYVGYNSCVALIDVTERKVEKVITLGSTFYTIVHLVENNILLIIFELGLAAISENGDMIWEFNTDVIETYQLEESKFIRLSCMDDSNIRISLLEGKVK